MQKPRRKRLIGLDRCTLELPKAFEKYPEVKPKRIVNRELKSFVCDCMRYLFRE